MKIKLAMIVTVLFLEACGGVKHSDEVAKDSCPDPSNTSIDGVENDQWTTLDPPGGHNSQVHLQAKKAHNFSSVRWEVGRNRQTCSSSSISASGSEYYLQISYNPTLYHMRVAAGRNYIPYTLYGCIAALDCKDVIEVGTIVLEVNYIK